MRPILDSRNPELGKQIDLRFADVAADLAKYRTAGGFVNYDSVDQAARVNLSRHIDALSAVVSQVQPIIAGG